MRIWFDTEFIENGRTIDLLSIGMVREDGREFYAEANWTDHSKASAWVEANVLPRLQGWPRLNRGIMAQEVVRFAGEAPEFWADYCSYDWVVLCQLFGTMMDLPSGWPMWCRDFQHLLDTKGRPKIPAHLTASSDGAAHNALADARALARQHAWLEEMGATDA